MPADPSLRVFACWSLGLAAGAAGLAGCMLKSQGELDGPADAGLEAAPETGPVCGDGTRTESEACDGTDLGGATCKTLGFPGGGDLLCKSCQFDTHLCKVGYNCGNQTREPGEDCDGADVGGKTCLEVSGKPEVSEGWCERGESNPHSLSATGS